jgi:superfamily II DNA helicase RecQ
MTKTLAPLGLLALSVLPMAATAEITATPVMSLYPSLGMDEARSIEQALVAGELDLVYMAPERLHHGAAGTGPHQPVRYRRGPLRGECP